MLRSKYLVLAIAATLATTSWGCGITEQAEARRQMLQSQNTYLQCQQQDRPDTVGCEGYKQIYESDMKAYQTASEKTSVFGLMVAGCPPLYALVQAYNSWKGRKTD
ncbi:MAG TPA: hypothetical protein VMB26_06690 [Candidatus Binataceae bacterium]|nr:hypothetical protein [Candidatus Binataceae bacterium]